MDNLEALQSAYRKGKKLKFVFFWKPEPSGSIGPGCFSQWQSSVFIVDGQRYVSTEQYMMAEKARLFDDRDASRLILKAASPQQFKQLGRTVRNFSEPDWQRVREDIVFKGNLAKFGQNEAMRDMLLGTKDKILAEASSFDRVWGIGLESDDPAAKNPLLWKGLNLLGFSLMRVRSALNS